MNPFEFINSINTTKKDIMVDDIAESKYAPFVVNRSLSYFPDTVLFANEMNINHHIDHRLQFDFYRNIVKKKKRFSKWLKSTNNDDINVIKEYYGYSEEKACQALPLFNNEQLIELKSRLYKGGK